MIFTKVRLRILILAVCLSALVLAGFPGHAQDTGGSMGGADFSSGDGGGSDSGSSSSSSSEPSYGGGSSSGGSTSSGGDGSGFGLVFLVGLVVLFLVLAPFAKSKPAGAGTLYLSSLVLGIDWHARRALQAKLAELAAQNLGGTAAGRAKMLQEVVLALQRAELSWLYIASEATPGLSAVAAESQFLAACNEARSRFRRELIRSEGGEVATEGAGAVAIRPEEGAGTVVVSLILVTRQNLAGRAGMSDAAEIRAALADRAAVTSSDLVAIEVVWSPAAEDDRMSTAELEQHYPELSLIDPKSIAGRLFCSYCGGAFAMELLNCPHCGGAVGRSA